ncbi:hypothetical protein phiK7A1_061 [Pseudomonas phage phiK7A1]|uniref:Uncharacterized protein n=1 Tax=Pseudomonas phage phiK7A1 TaxID=2759194 RepID=A0A7H0XFQ9_9CAUD|nr:hypothetical protein phiK7A1_061 [Pseudomonas phage phiK7A1]
MSEIILAFQNAIPNLVLLPVGPDDAPAEFAQVIVGEKGDTGDLDTVEDIDSIAGFTTDPLFYYLLARQ